MSSIKLITLTPEDLAQQFKVEVTEITPLIEEGKPRNDLREHTVLVLTGFSNRVSLRLLGLSRSSVCHNGELGLLKQTSFIIHYSDWLAKSFDSQKFPCLVLRSQKGPSPAENMTAPKSFRTGSKAQGRQSLRL